VNDETYKIEMPAIRCCMRYFMRGRIPFFFLHRLVLTMRWRHLLCLHTQDARAHPYLVQAFPASHPRLHPSVHVAPVSPFFGPNLPYVTSRPTPEPAVPQRLLPTAPILVYHGTCRLSQPVFQVFEREICSSRAGFALDTWRLNRSRARRWKFSATSDTFSRRSDRPSFLRQGDSKVAKLTRLRRRRTCIPM
jgi:hypothetical protein